MTIPHRGVIMLLVIKMTQLKTKHRKTSEKKALIKRIRTIEGQMQGIEKMLENDRYCNDILIQISAASKSLKSLGAEILKNHLASCVVKEIKNDNLEILDEVMDLIRRLD